MGTWSLRDSEGYTLKEGSRWERSRGAGGLFRVWGFGAFRFAFKGVAKYGHQ